MKILDFQNNGLGDVVLGSWIVHSANQIGEKVLINPRNHHSITELLSIPEENITRQSGGNWTALAESGFTHELKYAHEKDLNRFEFWSESLDLHNLPIHRPNYNNKDGRVEWAEEEWKKLSYNDGPRVIVLPEATRVTRTWPIVYWHSLVQLLKPNYNVCMMGLNMRLARTFDCFHFWGHSTENLAAMLKTADIVISADSGGAHLASTLQTPTISLQGPTIGRVVFDHDEYAHPLSISKEVLECVACNFSEEKGFRKHCNDGCQALYLLPPKKVLEKVSEILR